MLPIYLLLACTGADPATTDADTVESDTPDTDIGDSDTTETDDTDLPEDTAPPVDTALEPFAFDPSKMIDMSDYYGCAHHPAYGLQCWGSSTPVPPFPDPYENPDTISTAPAGIAVTAIATGHDRALAIDAQGTLMCWPGRCSMLAEQQNVVAIDNRATGCTLVDGGHLIECSEAIEIDADFTSVVGWVDVIDLGAEACGLRADGSLDCFGQNPDPRPGAIDQVDIVSGSGATGLLCGITTAGEVFCDQPYPSCVALRSPPGSDWQVVDVANRDACALDSTGHITCWGGDGFCGYDASPWLSDTPTTGRWVAIAVSNYTACAMKPSGKVRCWGNNRFLQATPPTFP